MSTTLIYQLALSQIPFIGPILAKNLVGYCGGAEAVFSEKYSNLLRIPGIGEKLAKEVYSFKAFDRLHKEVDFITSNEITTSFFTESDYPFRLKHIPDAPILLYAKGTVDLNSRMIAVIGTRKASAHGRELTEELVSELLPYQPTIVSGLAYGIDAYAHKSALKCGLPTLGVLAHGLDRIYPMSHHNLADKMIQSGGGLVTEYMSRTNPDRENFPMRNRIVAGMVDAVLVIETPLKGGSMITANLAFDYDREVLAIPGRVSDIRSQGCNYLVKSNRAHLVESADDIARVMNWGVENVGSEKQIELPLDLSSEERIIFEALKEDQVLGIDVLSEKVSMPVSKLAISLLEMEFKNLVRCLPGKQYELI